MKYYMQMPAAVEFVGDSEGQSESQFGVSERAPLGAAASSWAASTWESWRQWRPEWEPVAVTENAPAGACGP